MSWAWFFDPHDPRHATLWRVEQVGPIFAFRGVVHTIAVTLWFYAMARIPIADVTAMNYLSPVYVTLGAALFLGETLAMRRLVAVLGALVGAMIIFAQV